MISFKPYSPETSDELRDEIASRSADTDGELLREIFESLSQTFGDGVDCAVSYTSSCLLIRLFIDEYIFAYPIALSDEADERSALEELRAYVIKEEIPLVICDIPEECLDELTSLFSNPEVTEEDDGIFTLRAYSEIMTLDEIPSAHEGKLSLTPLDPERDTDGCQRLALDEENNRFWGYNYLLDKDSFDGSVIDEAIAEFERGVALTLSIRESDVVLGEAILYAVDLKGGCECAVRLLPEHQGRGLGKSSVKLLLKVAEEIGIKEIYATVMEENLPSIRLFEKFAKEKKKNDKGIRFNLVLR